MSAGRKYLELHGWRLLSRLKMGMYIKERWYHPRDGSSTFSQEQAIREQRRLNRAAKVQALRIEEE